MITWKPDDETVKPGLYVVARSALMGFHLEVAEKVEGTGKFVNSQWKDGIPFVSLVAELEEPGTDRERRDAAKAKKLMHPEAVYPILRDAFIAKAQEYGVDITSGRMDEFLDDLYDKCYEDLAHNLPEDSRETCYDNGQSCNWGNDGFGGEVCTYCHNSRALRENDDED